MSSLVGTEVSKQFRRPRTYIGLGLMVAIPLLVTYLLYANPPGRSDGRGNQFFYLAQFSGLLMPVAALQFMSRLLLVAVVAMFAGDAIASEAAWGNLRALLTRPIGRSRLLAAKFGVVVLLTVSATALIALAGLAAGVVAFGWHPVDLPFAGIHQSTGELAANLLVATLYVALDVAGIAGIGFMVSTMTDSPMAAAASAFGAYIVSSILDNIDAVGSIRNVFPTHYFDAWNSLFTSSGASSDMVRGALLQLGYLVVACTIGWWWFRRKDVLS
jgi:ABC-2 type transport system permease protein